MIKITQKGIRQIIGTKLNRTYLQECIEALENVEVKERNTVDSIVNEIVLFDLQQEKNNDQKEN